MSEKTKIDPKNFDKEESLSLSRLKSLVVEKNSPWSSFDDSDRPKANLIDLMKWVERHFFSALADKNSLNIFLHNRIAIDGEFLTFCDQQKIAVKTLYKDSIVSWRAENESEKFFAQGVFLVRSKSAEFLIATLFHKGHENEDEISFFVISSESNYENYVKLRNDFEDWCQARERDALHVKVVDGNDIPYARNHSWNDLFLPKDLKEDIKNTVEVFLASKDFYESHGLPWKRGLLLYGEPGCGKSSIIKTIMSNYNFKPVTIGPAPEPSTLRDAFLYAEEQSPSLLYFEDLDSLLQKVDVSEFLNLMDGISTRNGLLVIATANDISRFKTNITDRPSRFDRKIQIPSPDFSMALGYIKKMFGSSLALDKARSLAKIVSSHSFSYAYIKELYISSMFEAISNNRKKPTEKDIYNALGKVMKDKNITKSGKVTMNKYVKKNEVS